MYFQPEEDDELVSEENKLEIERWQLILLLGAQWQTIKLNDEAVGEKKRKSCLRVLLKHQ